MSRKKNEPSLSVGSSPKMTLRLIFIYALLCHFYYFQYTYDYRRGREWNGVVYDKKFIEQVFMVSFFFVVGSLGSVDRVFLRLSEDFEARETVHNYHLKVWTIMRRQMTTMKSRVKPPQQREWWVWDQQPPRNLINGSGWRFLFFFFSAREKEFFSPLICAEKKANNAQTIFSLLFWRYLEVVKLIL